MVPDVDSQGNTHLTTLPGGFGNTLRVITDQAGDLQWISLPVFVSESLKIKGVRVCYDLGSATNFISQIRLAEETVPPTALVQHDDGTDLTSVVGECVLSPVADYQPAGAVTVSLRLNFAGTGLGSFIDIGAIGLVVGL